MDVFLILFFAISAAVVVVGLFLKIKKIEKDGELGEDDAKKALDEVQHIIDKYTKEIDSVVAKKEAEIMEI